MIEAILPKTRISLALSLSLSLSLYNVRQKEVAFPFSVTYEWSLNTKTMQRKERHRKKSDTMSRMMTFGRCLSFPSPSFTDSDDHFVFLSLVFSLVIIISIIVAGTFVM
jgi:hypothetical protein